MRTLQWWNALALTAWMVALGDPSAPAQDAKPLERKALDTSVFNTLREVINRGADLYNGGDWNGCYRLYEGSLMSLRPVLDHRPELQKAITDGLAKAQQNGDLSRRAFDLRGVIDQVRAGTNPNPKPATLWDRLGGEPNVRKVVDDFVEAAVADKNVDFSRGGKYKLDEATVKKLKQAIVEHFSSVSGGPLKYNGPSMKESHKGMGITEAQFNALAGHLQAALQKNGAKPEDIKVVMDVVASTKPDIVESGPKPPDTPKPMTLWDRLGGETNVRKVVDDFVGAAATDPKVDFFRGGKFALDAEGVKKFKQHLVAQISSVSGGPLKYEGRSMKESHKGMGVTKAQFDALAGHLKTALEKNGAKPDDVKAVMGEVAKTEKDIVEETKPDSPKPPEPPKPMTLWDKLGGEANVKKVVDTFVAAAATDTKVDFTRGGKYKLEPDDVAHLKKMLVEQISSVSGGPYKYEGKSMKEVHKGMSITKAQFDALAGHLKAALEKHGAKPDDVKAVMDVIASTEKDIVEK